MHQQYVFFHYGTPVTCELFHHHPQSQFRLMKIRQADSIILSGLYTIKLYSNDVFAVIHVLLVMRDIVCTKLGS